MKRILWSLAVLAAAVPTWASTHRPLIVSSQDHSLAAIEDCRHFFARTATSFPAQAEAEEDVAVSMPEIDALKVRGSTGGSVSIRGWDRPTARLTVCKYAVALTELDARQTLREVFVSTRGGAVSTTGPETNVTRAWWVHMILRVPKKAALDVASNSGGIAIRNMTGRVTARATNGGISLAGTTGVSTLFTDNGGISIENVSGRIDASTNNGSISLRVPAADPPTIEARTDVDNEIVCRASICSNATPTRSGGSRVLRIGAAQPTIRLHAGSAPIIIEQVR